MKKLLAAALICASSLSHAALISSSADPALAGGSVIDFTGMATGNASSYTVGDVTFSTSSGTLRIKRVGGGERDTAGGERCWVIGQGRQGAGLGNA